MGLTFEAPTSLHSSAYDKAHRRRPPLTVFPSAAKGHSPKSSLTKHMRNPFRRSQPNPSIQTPDSNPAAESLLFRLPATLRHKIYGYLVGQNEVLHILMKRRAAHLPSAVAYRRCRAGGNVEDCVMMRCKEFRDVVNRTYYGSFDRIGGLLLTCRDIYKEASQVLYSQNILDFDNPLALITLSHKISPNSLHSIRSISIQLEKNRHATGEGLFHVDQGSQMWDIIADMQGLEEVRVRLLWPPHDLVGMSKMDILRPLWNVKQPLKVFDVESQWTAAALDFETDENGRERPFKLTTMT